MLKVTFEIDTDNVPVLTNPFGLNTTQLTTLRTMGLKPEMISADPGTQHLRVHELLHWFARLAEGRANPKWTVSHAYELAYYIAITNMNSGIDLSKVKQNAFLQGVNITAEERELLVSIGIIEDPYLE